MPFNAKWSCACYQTDLNQHEVMSNKIKGTLGLAARALKRWKVLPRDHAHDHAQLLGHCNDWCSQFCATWIKLHSRSNTKIALCINHNYWDPVTFHPWTKEGFQHGVDWVTAFFSSGRSFICDQRTRVGAVEEREDVRGMSWTLITFFVWHCFNFLIVCYAIYCIAL